MLKTSLLLIFLLCALTGSAQQVRFGIFGGFAKYDAPSYEENTTEEINSATATNAGAFVDYNVLKNYGVVFRLAYTTKKIAFEEQTDLQYVDLGLLLKMDLDNTYAKGVYIFMGPKIGLLTTANIDGVEIEDGVNNTQLGIIAGAGVHLNKFLELDLFMDTDMASVFSRQGQQVKVLGFGLNLKLEMNAMLNWHVPSVDPLKKN